ncbi:MAG: biotin/lipoyl-binding protein [Rikenellaceae bacterium]|nr:biotin/lipoyl-binding protein [Rikenellaceae bacterium]
MKEYKFKIHGNEYNVSINNVDNGIAKVAVNGAEYEVEVAGLKSTPKVTKISQTPAISPDLREKPKPRPTATSGAIKSPLPGVILEILVKEGQSIKAGDRICVLEAMKMENNIESDRKGIVKSVKVGNGDSVLEGDALIIVE